MSDETQDEVVEEVTEGEEAEQQENSTEERARMQGWADKDEWKGNPDQWVDAETFLKRGEDQVPILRERQRRMENQYKELKDTLKKFVEHHKNVSQREYDRALADIKRQKAEAVELGDKDAFTKAETLEENLRSNKPEDIDLPKEDTDINPEFTAWLADNQWYSTDKVCAAVADRFAEELAINRPDLRGRAFFDAVKTMVKQELPHKFDNPKRRSAPAVEGDTGKPKKGGKTYADLPAEAKDACDKFVKQGIMTKEQYLKEYDWS